MLQTNIILVGGPTASGKSALAMNIARERGNCVVINADAMQVYAGLPVLTAQPDREDRAEISHFLYEVVDPSEAFSAGKWMGQARKVVEQAKEQGQTPILVGGTGLYFSAFFGGLADIPSVPEVVRKNVSDLYVELGEETFRAELAKIDSDSAFRIARNDRQRLIRAYEVAAHTGKTLGEWHKVAAASGSRDSFHVERHLLLPEREELYTACDKRFLQMIERGAVDEVKALLARDLSPDLPAMKILGVREIASYLRGEIDFESAVEKAQQATRNYAKRQMTWFRNTGFGLGSGQLGKESVNKNPVAK